MNCEDQSDELDCRTVIIESTEHLKTFEDKFCESATKTFEVKPVRFSTLYKCIQSENITTGSVSQKAFKAQIHSKTLT